MNRIRPERETLGAEIQHWPAQPIAVASKSDRTPPNPYLLAYLRLSGMRLRTEPRSVPWAGALCAQREGYRWT